MKCYQCQKEAAPLYGLESICYDCSLLGGDRVINGLDCRVYDPANVLPNIKPMTCTIQIDSKGKSLARIEDE